jgi:hypothetical protein
MTNTGCLQPNCFLIGFVLLLLVLTILTIPQLVCQFVIGLSIIELSTSLLNTSLWHNAQLLLGQIHNFFVGLCSKSMNVVKGRFCILDLQFQTMIFYFFAHRTNWANCLKCVHTAVPNNSTLDMTLTLKALSIKATVSISAHCNSKPFSMAYHLFLKGHPEWSLCFVMRFLAPGKVRIVLGHQPVEGLDPLKNNWVWHWEFTRDARAVSHFKFYKASHCQEYQIVCCRIEHLCQILIPEVWTYIVGLNPWPSKRLISPIIHYLSKCSTFKMTKYTTLKLDLWRRWMYEMLIYVANWLFRVINWGRWKQACKRASTVSPSFGWASGAVFSNLKSALPADMHLK